MTAISQLYRKKYSVKEYLELEINDGQKFEYYNGKLHPMAGGTFFSPATTTPFQLG